MSEEATRARWGAVPLVLLADPVATYRSLKVYLVLSAMQGRRRHVQATLGAIAALAHVDERHTRRALASLEQGGWIHRSGEPNKASIYQVMMVRAGPGGGAESAPKGGRISPGQFGPPSPCLPPSPPLRSSPEEHPEEEAAKGEPEGETQEAAAVANITPAPEGFSRWRLRLNREIGRSVLDKPKTRAAYRALHARGLSDDDAVAYAVAEWHALPDPRQVGHLVQAVLDGDHLDVWLARRARRLARQDPEQLELGTGQGLAFKPIPEKDWMAAVHERRKAAGSRGRQ